MSKVQKFCRFTELVTLYWIRNNYKETTIYPLCLKYLSVKYIEAILEQWNKSSFPDCIVLAQNCQTITQIRPNYKYHKIPTWVYGSMKISTNIGHHEWELKINLLNDNLSIGVNKINNAQNQRYHLLFYQQKVNRVIIRMKRTQLNVYVGTEERLKCLHSEDVDEGIYQLSAALFTFGDCITIINYKQID